MKSIGISVAALGVLVLIALSVATYYRVGADRIAPQWRIVRTYALKPGSLISPAVQPDGICPPNPAHSCSYPPGWYTYISVDTEYPQAVNTPKPHSSCDPPSTTETMRGDIVLRSATCFSPQPPMPNGEPCNNHGLVITQSNEEAPVPARYAYCSDWTVEEWRFE